ncbi:hypothetical protein YC2023_087029 [Brassica napus]
MALSCKLIFCGHSSKKTAIIIFSAIKNNHLGGLVSGYNVQAAKRKVKEHLSYHLLKATSKSETGSDIQTLRERLKREPSALFVYVRGNVLVRVDLFDQSSWRRSEQTSPVRTYGSFLTRGFSIIKLRNRSDLLATA